MDFAKEMLLAKICLGIPSRHQGLSACFSKMATVGGMDTQRMAFPEEVVMQSRGTTSELIMLTNDG